MTLNYHELGMRIAQMEAMGRRVESSTGSLGVVGWINRRLAGWGIEAADVGKVVYRVEDVGVIISRIPQEALDCIKRSIRDNDRRIEEEKNAIFY
jgi:hypothetical protein